jgi:hypothetical protein
MRLQTKGKGLRPSFLLAQFDLLVKSPGSVESRSKGF